METVVSIGIPCYNAESTIGKAIQSILDQTYGNWELIVIDDGSTDKSLDEIKKICDKRIKIISRENKGLPATLNEISRLATGQFMARMDADDKMHPQRLEKQLAYLEGNPNVDLLGTGVVCIDGEGIELGERHPASCINSPSQIFKGEVIYHPTLMGKAEWFKNNPYDENLIRSEDFELWCRTAGDVVIHNLPESLLFYREYAGNTSLSKYLLQSKISRQVILKYGFNKIGFITTSYLFTRRLFKDMIYILLKSIGLWHFAVAKRN